MSKTIIITCACGDIDHLKEALRDVLNSSVLNKKDNSETVKFECGSCGSPVVANGAHLCEADETDYIRAKAGKGKK